MITGSVDEEQLIVGLLREGSSRFEIELASGAVLEAQLVPRPEDVSVDLYASTVNRDQLAVACVRYDHDGSERFLYWPQPPGGTPPAASSYA